jgi:hypothetical protein
MGEHRKIDVGLVDLKRLVKRMYEAEVYAQARQMVETGPQNQIEAEAALSFAQLVSEATPEAEKRVAPRYRHLREALESGIGVDLALASFAHRHQ